MQRVALAIKNSRLIFVLGLDVARVNTAIGNYGHRRQRETCARNVSGKGPLVCADRFGSVTAVQGLQILGLRARVCCLR